MSRHRAWSAHFRLDPPSRRQGKRTRLRRSFPSDPPSRCRLDPTETSNNRKPNRQPRISSPALAISPSPLAGEGGFNRGWSGRRAGFPGRIESGDGEPALPAGGGGVARGTDPAASWYFVGG